MPLSVCLCVDLGQMQAGEFDYMALWRRTAEVKLPAMIDYVRYLLAEHPDQKLILFAHHQAVLDALTAAIDPQTCIADGDDDVGSKKRKRSKADSTKYIRIDGTTPTHIRQELCSRFQTDPATRVALLSLTAASTGLTLTAASRVIFAELFFNPGVLLQAEDRAHRIGRSLDHDCQVEYLLGRGTLDDRLWYHNRSYR